VGAAQAGCGKRVGVIILMILSGLDARVWGPLTIRERPGSISGPVQLVAAMARGIN